MKTLRILCLSLMPGLCSGQVTWGQENRLLIIDHVTVVTPAASLRGSDVSVVIAGERIESVGPYSGAKRRAGAVVVDGRGRFLIAGLWDMHVHSLSKGQPEIFFPLFVANGVTGIRDMGGDLSLREIAEVKEEIKSGGRLGLEIFAAGPILEGEYPFWPFSLSVKNRLEARRAVSQLAGEKADFLKVYNTLSRDAYLGVASEAKNARIPFVGHIPDSVTPAEASDFGQKSIEHLWGISPYLSSNPDKVKKMTAEANDAADPGVARDLFYEINQTILSGYDPEKGRALFAKFARNGTWQTPTLVVLRS